MQEKTYRVVKYINKLNEAITYIIKEVDAKGNFKLIPINENNHEYKDFLEYKKNGHKILEEIILVD